MSETNFAIFLIRNQQSNEILYRNIYIYIHVVDFHGHFGQEPPCVSCKIDVCFPPLACFLNKPCIATVVGGRVKP